MAADPVIVARITAILRKHLAAEGAERIARVAIEIGYVVAPSEPTVPARQARLGGTGRTGELPDRIFALLMDGEPRSVAEICGAIANGGVIRKQVYSGLGYLTRRRAIERLGHARYRVLQPASERARPA